MWQVAAGRNRPPLRGRGCNRPVSMISFVTPYWNGQEMMRLHLASVRRFHPSAPILVSKTGGGRTEMEEYRRRFGIEYWLEECDYVEALLRLLMRCRTEYVCVMDHDTVLLSSVQPWIDGIAAEEFQLVGVEERIREPPAFEWQRFAPQYNGWMRFAPGLMDATFLLFNLRQFLDRHGLAGVRGRRPVGAWDYEYHYGICQKLPRHRYLRPYHTARYGTGNLIVDDATGVHVLWHQWYGSHRLRLEAGQTDFYIPARAVTAALASQGETAFLTDFPDLDMQELKPAWAPGWDLDAERRAARRGYPSALRRNINRFRSWLRAGPWEMARRVRIRLARWRAFWRFRARRDD
jgi:hypothetical protein